MTQAAELYQFPVSHYCEKARWALDAARVTYQVKNLAFLENEVVVRKLTGQQLVPALSLPGQTALAGSDEIVRHAARSGAPWLLDGDDRERFEIDAWTRAFDDELGPAVRVVAYASITASLPTFNAAAFRHLDPTRRALSTAASPLLRGLIRRHFRLDRRLDSSRASVESFAARLDAALEGRRYLVGNRFTAADLAGASLLAPLLDLPATPWHGLADVDPKGELRPLRASLMRRRIGRWAEEMYARHR